MWVLCKRTMKGNSLRTSIPKRNQAPRSGKMDSECELVVFKNFGAQVVNGAASNCQVTKLSLVVIREKALGEEQ